jgi:hypothetical protein
MSAGDSNSSDGHRAGRGKWPTPKPSFRAKLEESWSLLVAGAGCLALAVLLELQRSTRTVDHLSPTFLFLAVGLTGVAGGVASFMVGPEEDGEEVGERSPENRPQGRGKLGYPTSRRVAPERWNGRPVPDVMPAGLEVGTSDAGDIPTPWTEGSEEAEIAPSLLLDIDPSRRHQSMWNKGRILRLSEEGNLTVYSLDDALRDLELIEQVVHARRRGKESVGHGGGRTSSDRHPNDT